MIKIVSTVNNRQTLFLGLDRANTTRLHEGQPIVFDAQVLLRGLDEPVQDIVICAGETLEELHGELSKYLPLPPFTTPEA